MGMILKGVLALFWLLVIPFAVGILFFHNRQARRAGEYVLTGYTVMLAMMEILALPMIYLNLPLHVLVVVYGVLAVLLACLGAVSFYSHHSGGNRYHIFHKPLYRTSLYGTSETLCTVSFSCFSGCGQQAVWRAASGNHGAYCISGCVYFAGVCGSLSVWLPFLWEKCTKQRDLHDFLWGTGVVFRVFHI